MPAKKAEEPTFMTVRATAKGYYGRLREPGGPAFEIDAEMFSENWMEAVEEPSQADEVAIAQEKAADKAAEVGAE